MHRVRNTKSISVYCLIRHNQQIYWMTSYFSYDGFAYLEILLHSIWYMNIAANAYSEWIYCLSINWSYLHYGYSRFEFSLAQTEMNRNNKPNLIDNFFTVSINQQKRMRSITLSLSNCRKLNAPLNWMLMLRNQNQINDRKKFDISIRSSRRSKKCRNEMIIDRKRISTDERNVSWCN